MNPDHATVGSDLTGEVFPFIVGRGRSGTTLLRAMFDTHPELAVPDETHFIVPLGRHRCHFEGPEHFLVDTFLAELLPRPGFVKLGLSTEALRQSLKDAPPANYPQAIRRIFQLYAQQRGKSRFADKTPMHVHNIGYLARLFPESQFIHIIRDGRDVTLSYLDVAWNSNRLGHHALAWKRAVQAGRAAGHLLGSDRYQEVRYEELINEPEATLRGLCRFIHLPYDPVMLRYFERADEVVAPMTHPEARQGLYKPPTKGVRDWRRQMPGHDIELFEALAGDFLDQLGYERSPSKLTVPVKTKAKAVHLRFHAERLANRARKLV